MASCSERIKQLRKENKLTQAKLAEAIGNSEDTVQSWEKGRRNPDKRSLQALMDFFDVSYEYLIGTTFFRHVSEEASIEAVWVEDVESLNQKIEMLNQDLSPLSKYELFAYGRELIKKENPSLFAEKYAEKVPEKIEDDNDK